jgi:hypothetical protein
MNKKSCGSGFLKNERTKEIDHTNGCAEVKFHQHDFSHSKGRKKKELEDV